MELFRLENQVAFVTGAGSGIGQRLAIGLAEAGANVACFDLPTSQGLGETADQIEALGRKALITTGDVRHKTDLEQAVRQLE